MCQWAVVMISRRERFIVLIRGILGFEQRTAAWVGRLGGRLVARAWARNGLRGGGRVCPPTALERPHRPRK